MDIPLVCETVDCGNVADYLTHDDMYVCFKCREDMLDSGDYAYQHFEVLEEG